jgi:hypothetical protein
LWEWALSAEARHIYNFSLTAIETKINKKSRHCFLLQSMSVDKEKYEGISVGLARRSPTEL